VAAALSPVATTVEPRLLPGTLLKPLARLPRRARTTDTRAGS